MKLDRGFETLQAAPKLIAVPDEAIARDNLLKTVTVTDSGIAVCRNPLNNAETFVAAVRISDQQTAELAPLVELTGRLRLALPSDKPSRIGFFVGHQFTGEVSAVARVGDYPGTPLTIRKNPIADSEVPYGVSGFKDAAKEQQQRDWFNNLGLGSDRFTLDRVRGIFEQGRQEVAGTWVDKDLVIVPESLEGMIKDVAEEDPIFQILLFQSRKPVVPSFPSGMRGGGFGMTRGGGYSLGYGAESTHQIEGSRGSEHTALLGAFQLSVE